MGSRLPFILFLLLAFLTVIPVPGHTQGQTTGYEQNLFKEMKWRLVGPFHGGRTLAVTGVAGEPNVFFFGAPTVILSVAGSSTFQIASVAAILLLVRVSSTWILFAGGDLDHLVDRRCSAMEQ